MAIQVVQMQQVMLLLPKPDKTMTGAGLVQYKTQKAKS